VCGINGIFSLGLNGDFSASVKRMNDTLAHRGPDDHDVFCTQGLAIGHRRLSIIDPSAAGHQPMFSANQNLSIVFNGEIYNYRELRDELAEHHFTTGTDTEVLLVAYEKWGPACLDKLNGMFAFAIWDKQKEKLFIARDRLGIKPLYLWQSEDALVFSSELRGVMASGLFTPAIDRDSLGDFLRYQTVHAPATIISGVKMLMPGHFLLAEKDKIEIRSWWQPRVQAGKTPDDYAAVCADVRRLLFEAVERRLVADVPFGAFLSGGIDSSAVVGMMSQASSQPVVTFSVSFDDSEFSEAVYARMIAKKFGTDHHEILLKPEDFLNDLPAALDAMDHPSGDGPNTYIVSKATRKAGIKMALSGLGGDEVFAGYDIFRRAVDLEQKRWLNNIPVGLRRLGGAVLRKAKPGVAGEKISAVLGLPEINFKEFYPLSRQVLLEAQVRSIAPEIPDPQSVKKILGMQSERAGGKEHFLSAVSLAEIETYMQNVLLRDADQMSMAHALEVRVPFLDYKLVEYVLNVPDKFKFPVTPKKLLTDALGDMLPSEIVNRPKMGFVFPWKRWMKNELKSFCEERLNWLGKSEMFDAKGIEELWQAFLRDDPRVTYSRIWPLVVLAHWMKKQGING
jgi:asparagine synthase (glutamine-hydrolysing)